MAGGRKLYANPRPKVQISTVVVHCIFVTSSFVVLGCTLLAIGITCHLLDLDGSCPENLPAIVFGTAGALFVFSAALMIRICRKKRKEPAKTLSSRNNSLNVKNGNLRAEDTSVSIVGGVEEFTVEKVFDAEELNKVSSDEENIVTDTVNQNEDNFEMAQKSADVSYWIEQQDAVASSSLDCCPLAAPEDAKSEEIDRESLESEVTSL